MKKTLGAVYITDAKLSDGQQLALVELLLQGGVTAVQLRDHRAYAGEMYKLGVELRKLTHKFGAGLIVNDRVDVALGVGADGVHLGRLSLPVQIARKILGPDYLIGYSAHSLDDVLRAEKRGASYCSLSPIFYPKSKDASYPPLGVERLKQICLSTKIPIVALGGIEPIVASACRKSGAIGVAAIGALSCANDPRKAAAKMVDQPTDAKFA